jgi:alkaline phosphatase D
MSSRREFLQRLSALGLGLAGAPAVWPSAARAARLAADPFTLGIASGDPWPDGFVLWTRLAPDPLNGGGMPAGTVPVRWEVATDDAMRDIVKKGTAVARPDFAHAVHVEVRGLRSDRWYWYRFMTGDAQTLVGRARTMPAPDARVERMRLAFASCQHYEHGYYAAHRHLAREDVDLVAFLGDYIYESHAVRPVRRHPADEPVTLEDYRNRYALYKADPDLQAAHAAAPWIVTWDDHEVDNNYAGLVSQDNEPVEQFALRRAAAYRAYYEHLPLRRSSLPSGPDALLYRTLAFGRLARFHVLDTRQYRSDQVCGPGRIAGCAEWRRDDRTMLGATQERWLHRGLAASRTTWNVLAQQVVMMPIDQDPGPEEMYNMDSWSGYPVARQRLTRFIGERKVPNVVTLTGDVHRNFAGEVPGEEAGAGVAVEYVTTSISSGGDGTEPTPRTASMLGANPFLKYTSDRRGYVRCEVTPDGWHADYRIVPSVQGAEQPITTHASFITPAGASRVDRA